MTFGQGRAEKIWRAFERTTMRAGALIPRVLAQTPLVADVGAGGWQLPLLARETIGELHDRAEALKKRSCANVAAVVLAAKNARIILAMLSRGTEYRVAS